MHPYLLQSSTLSQHGSFEFRNQLPTSYANWMMYEEKIQTPNGVCFMFHASWQYTPQADHLYTVRNV